MNKLFRLLDPHEIECRVATINNKGLSLLLYKDARCDMNILDETVGAYKWKREHTRDNANCIVSIWNDDMKQWISKEDTGAESFTEKEKGLASDSFKRACFNWGIGRELYTAPFIWIKPASDKELIENNGKYKTYSKFKVTEIKYNDNNHITHLIITDQNGKVRFRMTDNDPQADNTYKGKTSDEWYKEFLALKLSDEDTDIWCKWFKVEVPQELTDAQLEEIIERFKRKVK